MAIELPANATVQQRLDILKAIKTVVSASSSIPVRLASFTAAHGVLNHWDVYNLMRSSKTWVGKRGFNEIRAETPGDFVPISKDEKCTRASTYVLSSASDSN